MPDPPLEAQFGMGCKIRLRSRRNGSGAAAAAAAATAAAARSEGRSGHLKEEGESRGIEKRVNYDRKHFNGAKRPNFICNAEYTLECLH